MTNNLLTDLPQHLPKEVVQTLIRAADVRIERIISHGHASPADFWYDQPQHEWVIVLKGAARLQFEDGMVEMKLGDFINIPAFRKHRVDWTTPDRADRLAGGALWGILLPPGDAALTRRVKAAGDHWVVAEKKGRKVFSRGIWTSAATIERIRADLEAERSTGELRQEEGSRRPTP